MKATWTVVLCAALFLISFSASPLDWNIGSLFYLITYSENMENASISTEKRSATVTCRDQFIGNGEDGETAIGHCNGQDASTVGNITYTCTKGEWIRKSNEDNCISAEIYSLYQEILYILQKPDVEKQIPGYLQNLSATVTEARTNISSSAANIKKVLEILSLISGAITKVREGVMTSVLEILDIVVDNPDTWTRMDPDTSTANCSLLLQTTDVFARGLEIVNNSINITTENIIFKEINVSSDTQIYINDFVKFNGLVISRGLSGYELSHPFIISMHFRRNNSSLANASNVSWDLNFTSGTTGWNTEDCRSNKQNGDITCMCDDLASLSGVWYSGAYFPISDPEVIYTLDYITYIGMGLSITSLLLCLIIEALVWTFVTKNKTSYMRHVCIVNIAISLLSSDIWFVISTNMASVLREPTNTTYAEETCMAAAFFTHFFYLSLFFWMFVVALIIFYRLVFVFHDTSKKTMLAISFCLGYGCPLIISTITVAVTEPSNGYRDDTACWLNMHETMAFLAFVVPAFIIVALNLIILFVVVAKHLRPAVGESPSPEEKRRLIRIIKSVPILTPLFGLTWGFGIALIYSQNIWILITFAILNSLQGLFILVFGILWDAKTREALARQFSLSRLICRLKKEHTIPEMPSRRAHPAVARPKPKDTMPSNTTKDERKKRIGKKKPKAQEILAVWRIWLKEPGQRALQPDNKCCASSY